MTENLRFDQLLNNLKNGNNNSGTRIEAIRLIKNNGLVPEEKRDLIELVEKGWRKEGELLQEKPLDTSKCF